MRQRLSQAKLQRLREALRDVIDCVHYARVNEPALRHLRPRRLGGFAAFLREMLSLPHDTDYRPFEVQLKRRLVRTQHRVFGRRDDVFDGSLVAQLPDACRGSLERYGLVAGELLKALSDVDIVANHQPLTTVRALLEASDA